MHLKAHLSVAVVTAILSLTGCDATPKFDQAKVVADPVARNCINSPSDGCLNQSVIVSGFVFERDDGKYRVNFKNPLSGSTNDRDFFVVLAEGLDHGKMTGKVRISGVITEAGFSPEIRAYAVEPAALAASEASARERRLSEPVSLASRQQEGAKALDEADAAIRANNTAMRRALEAKAVSHHTSGSGDLRVDVYGMPDGRHIACKTVVYDTGAPIMTCDGEP
jgi:hypothetical protein